MVCLEMSVNRDDTGCLVKVSPHSVEKTSRIEEKLKKIDFLYKVVGNTDRTLFVDPGIGCVLP